MYIFLFSLIINGLVGSTAVWPKVMALLLTDVNTISYVGCLTQIFFTATYGVCTNTLLTVMAYDRLVSIFQPLHIQSRVTNMYAICLIISLLIVPLLLVLLSYVKIIMFILKASGKARQKTFETCSPHIIVFVNFSLASLFSVTYNRVNRYLPGEINIFLTFTYFLVPPLLHPIIYGIKNQEIRHSLQKMVVQGCTFIFSRAIKNYPDLSWLLRVVDPLNLQELDVLLRDAPFTWSGICKVHL
ncbi:olfactory receptor 1N2-like [Sardina pilchardus]|uniref:olfactory receptor 1N2-like n=1 Tax=Sardina pilchardus TaxID=27697 RepID=UPI002E165503